MLESDNMREQLSSLAHSLNIVYTDMTPINVEAKKKERAVLFQKVVKTAPNEHIETLRRKAIIEKRKELDEEKANKKILENKLKQTNTELEGLIKSWERELAEIEQRK